MGDINQIAWTIGSNRDERLDGSKMTGRSQKAARYGALAEREAFSLYDLTPDRDSWHDAKDDEGTPWDVKACMLSRRAPRFRLWKEQHQELKDRNGGYVFVGYAPVGRGIRIINTRTVRAEDMKVSFYGAGSHDKGEQMKVPPSRVLDLDPR